MKIGIFSTYDHSGAGLAAVKINSALRKSGIKSNLYVNIKKNKNSIILKKGLLNNLLFHIKFYLSKLITIIFCFKQTKNGFVSLDLFNTNYSKIINSLNLDLIQINWINNFLSIEDIMKIKQPIIWRLSDMWPFVGIEHFTDENKWNRNITINQKIFDLDFITWKKKKKLLKKKMYIISPSKWLAEKARKSFLMRNRNISVIPTPIDPKIYSFQINNKKHRDIPKNKFIVLFSAKYLYEKRKGLEYFGKVTKILNELYPNKIHFVTVGKYNNKVLSLFPKNTTHFGLLNNEKNIVKIYNSSDIFFLLSTKDNLPQTALEAVMCGLPLISFNIGGVKEVIKNNFNGNILKNTSKLEVKRIMDKYIYQKNYKKLKLKIHKDAVKKYSSNIVIKKYLKLYKSIMSNHLKNNYLN